MSSTSRVADFKRAGDLSRLHEEAAIWLLRDFTNGLTLSAIKVHLSLFSNEGIRRKGSNMSYPWMVDQYLRRYHTSTAFANANKEEVIFNIARLILEIIPI